MVEARENEISLLRIKAAEEGCFGSIRRARNATEACMIDLVQERRDENWLDISATIRSTDIHAMQPSSACIPPQAPEIGRG